MPHRIAALIVAVGVVAGGSAAAWSLPLASTCVSLEGRADRRAIFGDLVPAVPRDQQLFEGDRHQLENQCRRIRRQRHLFGYFDGEASTRQQRRSRCRFAPPGRDRSYQLVRRVSRCPGPEGFRLHELFAGQPAGLPPTSVAVPPGSPCLLCPVHVIAARADTMGEIDHGPACIRERLVADDDRAGG